MEIILRVLAFADDTTGVTTFGHSNVVENELIRILEAFGMRSNAAKLERLVVYY